MGSVLMLGDCLFRACCGWIIWLRALCRFVFFCTVVFRNYALDRIFVQGKTYRSWSMLTPVGGLAISLTVFCVVAQAVPDCLTVIYLDFYESCHYVYGFRYTCIALNWGMWSLCLVITWCCRNIQICFNEYHESLATVILHLLDYQKMTLAHCYLPDYALHDWQCGLAASYDLLLTLVAIWIVLLYPMYQCLFHHEGYLQVWLKRLSQDGLRREYEVQGSTSNELKQFTGSAKLVRSTACNQAYDASPQCTLYRSLRL
ncbi:hypothetical protein DL89DRAFT_316804 [Linderina pennispora]|uniref:Uncharacterized protein n=1 Tax=Linderina pennispora TaxID=61395 RepID=A0A1Y1W758_9FUNG|nr:uncharacterized protein DL89DRAFT_316804 [Linderina pennispora]ORX69373.1 hypothetical protein DL89DRAFT_316804 [Linderina pennispora]